MLFLNSYLERKENGGLLYLSLKEFNLQNVHQVYIQVLIDLHSLTD